jgi:hypothetical protein
VIRANVAARAAPGDDVVADDEDMLLLPLFVLFGVDDTVNDDGDEAIFVGRFAGAPSLPSRILFTCAHHERRLRH